MRFRTLLLKMFTANLFFLNIKVIQGQGHQCPLDFKCHPTCQLHALFYHSTADGARALRSILISASKFVLDPATLNFCQGHKK